MNNQNFIILTCLYCLVIFSCRTDEIQPKIEVFSSVNGEIISKDTLIMGPLEEIKIYVHSNFGERASDKTDFSFLSSSSGNFTPDINRTGRTEGAYYETRYEIFINCDDLECETGDTIRSTINQVNTGVSFQFWITVQ